MFASAHEKLVHYLYTSELTIFIWDGESKIFYGYSKFNLQDLMRQGNNERVISNEISIIKDGDVIGSLLIKA